MRPSSATPGSVLERSADRVSADTCTAVRTAVSFTAAKGGSSLGPSSEDGRTEWGPPTRWTLWLCRALGRARLSATPWTAARQAPRSTKFSRQEYWSGLPFPSPGDLFNPRIEPGSLASQADSLPSEPPGKSDGTFSSVQFSSVSQSCLTLCDPMNCSMPGFPVHYQIPAFTQTHVESVMPSNHPILCCPLLLLPSIFPSIRVFSNESVLLIRWPKYWSFSFNISPSSEDPGLISFRMDWLDLLAVQGTLKSLL